MATVFVLRRQSAGWPQPAWVDPRARPARIRVVPAQAVVAEVVVAARATQGLGMARRAARDAVAGVAVVVPTRAVGPEGVESAAGDVGPAAAGEAVEGERAAVGVEPAAGRTRPDVAAAVEVEKAGEAAV